ncbi:Glutaredoxin 1 (Partial), partial [Seminavis robusta]|eukprot:Sro3531_g348960.1 Glutaredoxin 1 (346) ;mRNA; r:16-1146
MVGPVTVFTVENCPYCKQVTTTLEECRLPYTDISLSKFPQKRKDLLQLTGKVSVPQLFIHSQWIGGVDASLAYLRDFSNRIVRHSSFTEDSMESPLETLERAVGRKSNGSAAVNPRFMVPIMEEHEGDETDSTWCEEDECQCNDTPVGGPLSACGSSGSSCSTFGSSTDTTRIMTPDGSLLTVLETTELLKKVVLDYSQRRWNFTTYKNCCTAEEVINSFAQHYDISRREAECFGRLLHRNHIMHHVCNDHQFKDTSAHFWRLQCFHNPDILNSYRTWPVQASPHPEEALHRILNIFGKILATIITEEGTFNYRIAFMCSDYPLFEDAVCELQRVDLSLLEGPAMM